MGSNPEDRDHDPTNLDPASLRARLDRLSSELKRRAPPPAAPTPRPEPKTDGTGSAMSLGLRAGSEFISAVIVGSGIGWALDRALHTNPAFLIVFFLIGVAAGTWNVIRMTSPKAAASGRNSPLSRANPPDKDVPRPASQAGRDASLRGREAAGDAGDDEDE